MGAINRRCILIFVIGLVLSAGCAAQDDRLSIVAEFSAGGLLKFTLTNNYEEKLLLKTWQVPWTSSPPYPLAVSVHVLDPETNRPRVTEHAGVFGNDVLESIEIEPGGKIFGEIDIAGRFHDAEAEGEGNSLIVHWVYSLPICSLDTTFVHVGAAERYGESPKIIFQDTSETSAPPRCGD